MKRILREIYARVIDGHSNIVINFYINDNIRPLKQLGFKVRQLDNTRLKISW